MQHASTPPTLPLATDQSDIIIALATPQGTGAIAVIRISGTNAISLVNAYFKGKNLEKQATHTLHLGVIVTESKHDKPKNHSFTTLDEVLVSVFRSPTSYTKEDSIEISTHGSPFIVQKIIELFLSNGARLAKQGEFTLRAFANGRFSLSQAEAVADLIACDSEQALQLALGQMRGGFSVEIKRLRSELIYFASLLELELDFGEEDVEFASRKDLKALIEQILRVVNGLRASFSVGNVLKNGIATVIAGKPNAGKSTLMNVLMNEERSIVSSMAGTTRDVVEDVMFLKGIKFRLSDTAGIRTNTSDEIEQIGVERTFKKLKNAQLILYIFDASQTSEGELEQEIEALDRPKEAVLLLVGNKIDNTIDFSITQNSYTNFFSNYNFVFVSSKDRLNIDALISRMVEVSQGNAFLQEHTVSNLRHYDCLLKTAQSLESALEGLAFNTKTSDLIAMDIRRSLHHLGEITGEITTDDLLETIFSKFCIGK